MKKVCRDTWMKATGAWVGSQESGVRSQAPRRRLWSVRCLAWCPILMILFFGLGCQRVEQTEEKRITVALPQWFSPSEKNPWLQKAWQTIREENPEWTFDLELVP